MSTKKSFSIPKGLATGIRTSIQSATTHHGQLHYDIMAIEAIEPDPNNPRKLSITKDELFRPLNKNDTHYEKKLKELTALHDLAESIKRVGIRNAIEVYKEDNRYKIISGERRYLAAILAGQNFVPARINQKFEELKLRYIQWVENINRQDLSLVEKYNNLLTMASAFTKTSPTPLTADILREILGISETQAYRYHCLLNAEPEIIDLVKSEKLTNLKLVQELSCIKNKSARLKILAELQKTGQEVTSLNQFKKLKEKKSSTASTIHLGKVSHPHTAKYLLQLILKDAKFNQHQARFATINWHSAKDINHAFKTLLRLIEQEFNRAESAIDA